MKLIQLLLQGIIVLKYYYGTKIRLWFDGSCLTQEKVTFNHGKVVNICIDFKIIKIANIGKHDYYLTLQDALFAAVDALFAAVSLTKNSDIDKYGIQLVELSLIEDQGFHIQAVKMVKM